MFLILRSILLSIVDRIRAARDPIGFVRSLGVRAGDNVNFYGVSKAMFGSEPWMISFGNDCYIAAGVQFITHDGATSILRKEVPTLEWTAPIDIGNDVMIGLRTIIMPNVKIGNRCIVGAGSVVSKNIPDNSVYAGVPAKYICSTDEYLAKMKAKSLGCGHLHGEEKAKRIREIYQEKGWFDRSKAE